MYSIFITCQGGFESLVKRDCQKNKLKNITVSDRCIQWEWDLETIYQLLVWNRFANRVYINLAQKNTTDFDSLFDLCNSIDWKKYIPEWKEIVTQATSIRSQLAHAPSIQSITKKALIKNLTKNQETHHWNESRWWKEIHIQTMIIEDMAHILLDITGLPLHKRWWREIAGEAPLKENLASVLVALSWWKFRETLWDPFCGSGTIAIEAVLLARNIAPWKNRYFAIEHMKIHDADLLQRVKKEAKTKEYPSGKYTIIASDTAADMIQIAKENALKAGVSKDIDFRVWDFWEMQNTIQKPLTLISNPPYWVRLENENLDSLYEDIFAFLSQENVSGWVITSFEKAHTYINTSLFKNRKLYNGSIESRFWYRKKK